MDKTITDLQSSFHSMDRYIRSTIAAAVTDITNASKAAYQTESLNILAKTATSSRLRSNISKTRLLPPSSSLAVQPCPTSPLAEISEDQSRNLHERFFSQMHPSFPCITLSPDEIAYDVLRGAYPILFLCIITVALGTSDDVDRYLCTFESAHRIVSDRIIVQGEKSPELIQALLVLSIWSCASEKSADRPYLLMQLCCSMAIEIGLNRKYSTGNAEFKQVLERERLWLSCYAVSTM